MSCQRCKSERIMRIHGKTSDMFNCESQGKKQKGYVPTDIFFGKGGFGDYVSLEFCLECGQVQSNFPIPQAIVEKIFSEQQ